MIAYRKKPGGIYNCCHISRSIFAAINAQFSSSFPLARLPVCRFRNKVRLSAEKSVAVPPSGGPGGIYRIEWESEIKPNPLSETNGSNCEYPEFARSNSSVWRRRSDHVFHDRFSSRLGRLERSHFTIITWQTCISRKFLITLSDQKNMSVHFFFSLVQINAFWYFTLSFSKSRINILISSECASASSDSLHLLFTWVGNSRLNAKS